MTDTDSSSNPQSPSPRHPLFGRVVCGVGIVWLFGAFALYYRHRPLDLILQYDWRMGLPWMEDFRSGWNGLALDVVYQGLLLVWIAAVISILGWSVCRRLRLGVSGFGALVWGSGLALGGLGMGVFFLGVIGLIRWPLPVFGGLLVVLSVVAGWRWKSERRDLAKAEGSTSDSTSTSTERRKLSHAEWLVLFVIGGLNALALLYAFTPAIQSDALRYHLAAPQEWLKAGSLIYLPYNAFSNFPGTIDMLFLYGLGLAGDCLATGFHFLFFPLSIAAVGLLTEELCVSRDGGTRKFGLGQNAAGSGTDGFVVSPSGGEVSLSSRDLPPEGGTTNQETATKSLESEISLESESFGTNPLYSQDGLLGIRPGLLAALVWATSPLTLPLAGWAFIDLGVLFFTLGVIYFLLRWTRTDCASDWLVASVFGGLLAGSKYTGVMVVMCGAGLLLVFGFLAVRRGEGAGWLKCLTRSLAFGLIAAAIACPWWIRNVVHTGNPVYPLAYSVFGGGEWSQLSADIYAEKLKQKGEGRGVVDFFRLPWSTAANPERFGNFEIGPFCWVFSLWIVAWGAVSLVRIRSKPVPASLALWLLFLVVSWFLTYQDNRFLLPVLAIAMSIAACTVCSIAVSRPLLRLLAAAGLLLPVLYCGVDTVRWLAYDAGKTHWPSYTAGFLTRSDYLARNINYYRAAEYASTMLSERQKVLLVGEHRKFHWKCRVEGNDWYDAPRILPFLRGASDANLLLKNLKAAGFTHIFFNLAEWGWPEDERILTGSLPVPAGSAWAFNRRYFNDADIAKLESLLNSPRLRTVLAPEPGRIYLAEIR